MKIYAVILLFLAILPIVFSEAPPALPMEIWGQATIDGNNVSDGLSVEAIVNGSNLAQPALTQGGYFDVIVTGLDRELTYNDDSNCDTHWGNNEACVQCIQCGGANCLLGFNESTCIEGPQDGAEFKIAIDGDESEQKFTLNSGVILNGDISITGIIIFTRNLVTGWNMFSIPLDPSTSSLSEVLSSIDGSYDIVWTIVSGDWKSSTSKISPINTILPNKGYLILMNKNDLLNISGKKFLSTVIPTFSVWNTVGYPSITERLISNILSGLNYDIVWALVGGDWKSSTSKISPITNMEPGEGYLLATQTGGNYTVTGE